MQCHSSWESQSPQAAITDVPMTICVWLQHLYIHSDSSVSIHVHSKHTLKGTSYSPLQHTGVQTSRESITWTSVINRNCSLLDHRNTISNDHSSWPKLHDNPVMHFNFEFSLSSQSRKRIYWTRVKICDVKLPLHKRRIVFLDIHVNHKSNWQSYKRANACLCVYNENVSHVHCTSIWMMTLSRPLRLFASHL